MVGLTASGDVFRLGAEGEFDGLWMTSGRLRADAGVSYDGRVELCHGLDAEIGIEAAANIDAALTVFLPSVRAEGKLFAAAGAGVNAQLAPNIFEKVGLTVDLHAFAQASAAGRIGVALDFEQIAALAEQNLADLPAQLLVAFLNEIEIEAGVWGRASFSAMAQAHLEINGTVMGDTPGFQIAAGAGVGWGGGTAWDFYGRLGLDNPRRFYNTAVELIVAELATRARAELGREYTYEIEIFEFIAPLAAVTAFDLGEMASEELMRPANAAVQPFLMAFGQRVVFYILDKVVELAEDFVSGTIVNALSSLASSTLTQAERDQLENRVQAALDIVGDRKLTVETALDVIEPIVDILEIMVPEEVSQWEDELALLWSAVVAGNVLRKSAAKAEVSLSILGSSVSVGVEALAIPNPPAVVRRAYDRHMEPAPPTISLTELVDFIVRPQVIDQFLDRMPIVDATVGTIARELDLSFGDFVVAALTVSIGEDLTSTELYETLRDYARNNLEGVVIGSLLPEMKIAFAAEPDLVSYIDEVIEPIVLGVSGFVFERVDAMVRGMSVDTFDPFNKSFKAGLGDLAWLIFSRNVVFVSDVVMYRAIDELHSGFGDLAHAIRSDPGHVMSQSAVDLAAATFGPVNPVREDHIEAVRFLVGDLLAAGAAAFGPAIWDVERRATLKDLTRRLLEPRGEIDYSDDVDDVDQALAQVADCAYIPDVEGLRLLVGELAALTAEEFEVVLEMIVPAFELFFLRLTLQTVTDLEQGAIAFISGLADLLRDARETLQAILDELGEIADDVAAWGEAINASLDALATELARPAWREAVLAQLLSQGLDQAEATARQVPGFDQLDSTLQQAAVATARGVFDLAFFPVRAAIDLGLQGGAATLDLSGDALETAASGPGAVLDAAAVISVELVAGVEQALADGGLALPPELDIDDVETAILDWISEFGAIRLVLEELVANKQGELDATNLARTLADDRARAELDLAEQQAIYDATIGGPPEIVILSPAPVRTDENWVYPREIPIYARIAGARLSYVSPDAARRVFVAINGTPVELPFSSWSFDGVNNELVLRGTIATNIIAGLNTVEVTVVDGIETIKRETVSFLANPELEPRGGLLKIDGDRSQFDTPGDDHDHTEDEFVSIRNVGDQVIDLRGLRVADRARHLYIFDDVELYPEQVIELHTGSGTDSETKVFWGRTQAVWNNRGDAVYLYDDDRVLWSEFVYTEGSI